MTHNKRERDAIIRNSRPTKQTRLKVPQEAKGSRRYQYTTPTLGDNVFKVGKLVRVCSNRGCYEPVFVSMICSNGAPEYSCPKHGKRNRQQMKFMDITGSTMIQFKKIDKGD